MVERIASFGTGSLRRWRPRTPALVASITDHPWTVRKLSSCRVSLLDWQEQPLLGMHPAAASSIKMCAIDYLASRTVPDNWLQSAPSSRLNLLYSRRKLVCQA